MGVEHQMIVGDAASCRLRDPGTAEKRDGGHEPFADAVGGGAVRHQHAVLRAYRQVRERQHAVQRAARDRDGMKLWKLRQRGCRKDPRPDPADRTIAVIARQDTVTDPQILDRDGTTVGEDVAAFGKTRRIWRLARPPAVLLLYTYRRPELRTHFTPRKTPHRNNRTEGVLSTKSGPNKVAK